MFSSIKSLALVGFGLTIIFKIKGLIFIMGERIEIEKFIAK